MRINSLKSRWWFNAKGQQLISCTSDHLKYWGVNVSLDLEWDDHWCTEHNKTVQISRWWIPSVDLRRGTCTFNAELHYKAGWPVQTKLIWRVSLLLHFKASLLTLPRWQGSWGQHGPTRGRQVHVGLMWATWIALYGSLSDSLLIFTSFMNAISIIQHIFSNKL